MAAARFSFSGAQIERHAGHIALQEDVNANIRLLLGNRRALVKFTGEAVDDGVFHLQRAILAVADLFVHAAEMHGKSFIHAKNARPVDRLHPKVQIQVAVHAEFVQRQQNARSQAAPQQALVQKTIVTLKMYPALHHFAVVSAKRFQLAF